MALVTWFVCYKFKSNGQWVQSIFYVDKTSPDEARAAAEKMLRDAITAEWEILEVRMVGEGR